MIENQKKLWKSLEFLHKSPSKRWYRNGIHSELMPDGALTSFTICVTHIDFAGQTLLMTS